MLCHSNMSMIFGFLCLFFCVQHIKWMTLDVFGCEETHHRLFRLHELVGVDCRVNDISVSAKFSFSLPFHIWLWNFNLNSTAQARKRREMQFAMSEMHDISHLGLCDCQPSCRHRKKRFWWKWIFHLLCYAISALFNQQHNKLRCTAKSKIEAHKILSFILMMKKTLIRPEVDVKAEEVEDEKW